jgi:hypothetical protein
MSDFFAFIRDLLKRASTEKNQTSLIHDILTPLLFHFLGYLNNPINSPLEKLELILMISPSLIQFMETSALFRDLLFRVGCEVNITLICREISFYAESLPKLIDQPAYAAALVKFPSSEFPSLLADLPLFLKANLLNKYETLKEEASKAAAAAEKAKDQLEKAAFGAAFAKYWAEVPEEHLPALKEGMRLRREWWNGSNSSNKPLTEKQHKSLKSYEDFIDFVRLKMNGK